MPDFYRNPETGERFYWTGRQMLPVPEDFDPDSPAMVEAARRAGQAIGQGMEQLETGTTPGLSRRVQEREQVERVLGETAPVQAFLGRIAPNIAVGAASAPFGLGAAALSEAAIEGARYGTAQERAQQAALGAAATVIPPLAFGMAGRVASRIARQGDDIAAREATEQATLPGPEVPGPEAPLPGIPDLSGPSPVRGGGTGSAVLGPEAAAAREAGAETGRRTGLASAIWGPENPPPQDILEAAQRTGFRLTPGYLSGQAGRRAWEARIGSQPGGLGVLAREVTEPNRKLLRESVVRAMGGTGDDLSPTGLGKIADDIGRQFDELTEGVEVDMPAAMAQARQDIIPELAGDPMTRELVERTISDLEELGPVTGRAAYQAGRTVGRAAERESRSGNMAAADALKRVQDAIDENMAGEDLEKLAKARREWKVLRTVESAINAEGELQPGRLYNNLRRAFGAHRLREGATREEVVQTLFEVSRLAAIPDIVANSGTATRTAGASLNPIDLTRQLGYRAAMEGMLGNYGRAAGNAALLGGAGVGLGAAGFSLF